MHPFLRDLLEYWGVSLCNLHPNTILHIVVFIHFCEAYLGILPHFNLFLHLFWLKKKGGGGSKVVGGVYLQLRDGMVGEYIIVPLNTSLKGWNARWFYMKQSSGHPLQRRPDFGESEELVGEADQCRYGAGEGAPQANKGYEDKRSSGGGELHSAPRPAL